MRSFGQKRSQWRQNTASLWVFNPAQTSLKSRRAAGCKTFACKILGPVLLIFFILEIWQGLNVMKSSLWDNATVTSLLCIRSIYSVSIMAGLSLFLHHMLTWQTLPLLPKSGSNCVKVFPCSLTWMCSATTLISGDAVSTQEKASLFAWMIYWYVRSNATCDAAAILFQLNTSPSR